MSATLTAVWTFVKNHWQAILLVFVIAFGYAWFRHTQAGWADTVSKLNVAHQTEIDQINAAKAVEEKQHAQELQQLQDTLNRIQTDYAAAQAALAQQQTTETNQIVTQYGTDMNGLAALLASKSGFVVVTPPAQ